MESKFFLEVDNSLNLLTDEQLIEEIKNNNEKALDFLMDKYKNFVYARAKSYFIVGGEKQNSFKVFADLCIRRQIISAIKISTRQKQLPLNNCISLNTNIDEDNDNSLGDIIQNEIAPDPSDTIVNRETFLTIKSKMTSVLSKFEQEVLDKHLCGFTYTQIAKQLDVESKSVDNAIQRIKKKIQKNIYNDKTLF